MELNAYPDRLDLSDRHLRMAKQHGVKIVINTDSHHTSHMEKIRYGVLQARRAWLTREDVSEYVAGGEICSGDEASVACVGPLDVTSCVCGSHPTKTT